MLTLPAWRLLASWQLQDPSAGTDACCSAENLGCGHLCLLNRTSVQPSVTSFSGLKSPFVRMLILGLLGSTSEGLHGQDVGRAAVLARCRLCTCWGSSGCLVWSANCRGNWMVNQERLCSCVWQWEWMQLWNCVAGSVDELGEHE